MILDKIKVLLKHKTLKNIGFLTIGNILAQIIAVIGAFYIPKLLGPEKYGIYNTVSAYVGMLTVLTFTGLNKVVIRAAARDLSKSREILEATVGVRNLFSFFATSVALFVILFVDYDKGTKFYIFIFSFSLLFTGLQSTVNTIYQAHEEMKVLAIVAIIKQLLRVPLSILLLIYGYGVLSIIILQIAIQFTVLLINFYHSRKIIKFNVFSKIKFQKEFVISGINFSLLEFFNTLSGKIDIFMLSFLTTPQNVGVYALAYRLVEKGLIIKSPISQSLFPYYAKIFKSRKIRLSILFKQTIVLFLITALIVIMITFFSEQLIISFVGDAFLDSVIIFNTLIFYLLFSYSSLPAGLAVQTTNNEKYSVIVGVLMALLNISLNIIFWEYYGLIGIAYSTLVVEMMRFIFLINISTYISKYKR